MSSISKLLCGIILLTIPTVQYGGYYLLTVLSKQSNEQLTDFQQSMYRAGHAHAGVLTILALLGQLFLDHAYLPPSLNWSSRIGFYLGCVMMGGGFFAAAYGHNITRPTSLISIVYAGAVVLAISVIITGIGLIRAR